MKPRSSPWGTAPLTRGPKCILVVEDEILIRMMLSDELRDAGYDVIEAVDADEGLAVLHSGAPVDLMISDVRMPGSMDGIALLEIVKESFPTIPVIITSGHLHPAYATTFGGTHFIPKPYRLEVLVEVVANQLATGT